MCRQDLPCIYRALRVLRAAWRTDVLRPHDCRRIPQYGRGTRGPLRDFALSRSFSRVASFGAQNASSPSVCANLFDPQGLHLVYEPLRASPKPIQRMAYLCATGFVGDANAYRVTRI